jgi:phospholipid-binding lipoprotein MlaA
MKPRSSMVLFVFLFTIGCAHKTSSTLSLTQSVPSFEQQQITMAAASGQSPLQTEKETEEQSPAQSQAVTEEQSSTEPEKVMEEEVSADSEEETEDLSDKDLDFEEDLDFLGEEAGEGKMITVADPLEPFNRAMFNFNDRLYFWILKPTARGYNWVFPEGFRVSVRNFFLNLLFPVRFVSCILQANVQCAGIELSRFMVNSTLGVAGLWDPAKGLNLPFQDEDIGQTLGVWRMGTGFYLNMPVLGPYTLRSFVGWFADGFLDPVTWYVSPMWLSWTVKGYKKFNNVSLTLGDYEALKEAAIDPYVAVRNAYVQYRETLVKERGVKPRATKPPPSEIKDKERRSQEPAPSEAKEKGAQPQSQELIPIK